MSQRFSEAIRANGKASQEEILIDQMPDTPHSSLEVCFSIMCSILYMTPFYFECSYASILVNILSQSISSDSVSKLITLGLCDKQPEEVPLVSRQI